MAKKSVQTRAVEALTFAREKAAEGLSWQDIHNSLFGIGGFCSVNFADQSERLQFTKTDEYKQILAILDSQADHGVLREIEASGKLLVRLPKSLHAALMAEADHEGTSINQLIVAKLSAQLRSLAAT